MTVADAKSDSTHQSEEGSIIFGTKTHPNVAEQYTGANYENLRSVFEQANRIASTASLDDLLNQMLDLMVQSADGTNGTLYLHDADANELIFSVIRGSEEDQALMGARMRADKGIVGAAIASKQPIIIEDLASDSRWFREIHPELSARLHNAATLPLLVQGRTVGAVQIFNYKYINIDLLQLLANRMASEIEKALLLDKSRRANQRLQALVEAVGEISAILDRDQLLNALTSCASRLVHAQSSSVFLIDSTHEDGAQWLSRSSRPVPADAGSNGRPDIFQSHSHFQATSTLSVPLKSRPLIVGKERRSPKARTIGNLISLNKLMGSFDNDDSRLLESLASHASTSLQIATIFHQSNDLFLEFILALSLAIDSKEPFTRGHSQRVSEYSVEIATRLGVEKETITDIRIGALLHDIGKLGVPDSILSKQGTLSDSEFEEIKKHPGKGLKILENINALHNILPAVVEHHERLDGSGYPHGLYGDQISLMGRIVAVADVFDALTTDRPYRKAMLLDDVLAFFEQNRSNRFDSDCVEALERFAGEQYIQVFPSDR